MENTLPGTNNVLVQQSIAEEKANVSNAVKCGSCKHAGLARSAFFWNGRALAKLVHQKILQSGDVGTKTIAS